MSFMSFRLTCISSVFQQLVCTNMKEDIKASLFVRMIHWKQLVTPRTRSGMPKPFIKHQRSSSNGKNINQTTKFRTTDCL